MRGVFALGDSMAIGFRALSLSAQYAATDEDDEEGAAADELPRSAIIGAFVFAIAFGVGLFKWTPGIMARLLGLEKGVWFVLVEGGIKIALLVAYLAALNLVPDLKRVFQYHAAEHMAINALEAGDDLTVENVSRHSRIHVRCGTAFLLWVMLVSIVVFLFVTPDGWIPLLRLAARAPAADRGARLRGHPLRGALRHEPGRARRARAGPLAPAADDAAADERPARGLDRRAPPRAPAGAPGRRAAARRGHGVAPARGAANASRAIARNRATSGARRRGVTRAPARGPRSRRRAPGRPRRGASGP